jgi:hypothetical protein
MSNFLSRIVDYVNAPFFWRIKPSPLLWKSIKPRAYQCFEPFPYRFLLATHHCAASLGNLPTILYPAQGHGRGCAEVGGLPQTPQARAHVWAPERSIPMYLVKQDTSGHRLASLEAHCQSLPIRRLLMRPGR